MTDVTEPDQTDAALIRRGLAWRFSAEFVTQVGRIAFAFLLARLLTPTEYGLAGMALVVSGFVLVFSDLGLGTALVQRRKLSEPQISTVFWASVASGLLFTLIGIGASSAAATLFHQPEVRDLFAAMSLSFLITSLGATQGALLTRAMDFRAIGARNVLGMLIGGVVGVVVAVMGGGAWAIVAQQLTFAVVSTVLFWLATSWRPRLLLSLESVKDLGGFGANVLGNRFASILQETSAPLLIGRLLGAASLGLYTLANNVVLTPIARVTLPLGQVLFPALSRHQDDPARIGSMWLKSLSLSSAVTLPALAGLVVVAPDFVTVTLGEKWADVVPVIQILVWVGAARAVQGPTTAVVLAIGKPKLLFHFSIVYLVASIAAIVVGVPWGIIGVATAVMVVNVVLNVVWIGIVGRQVSVRFADYRLALSGVLQATVVMALTVWAVRMLLMSGGVDVVARLLLCIAAGFCVYLPVCRWRAPDTFNYLWRAGRSAIQARWSTSAPRSSRTQT